MDTKIRAVIIFLHGGEARAKVGEAADAEREESRGEVVGIVQPGGVVNWRRAITAYYYSLLPVLQFRCGVLEYG